MKVRQQRYSVDNMGLNKKKLSVRTHFTNKPNPTEPYDTFSDRFNEEIIQ